MHLPLLKSFAWQSDWGPGSDREERAGGVPTGAAPGARLRWVAFRPQSRAEPVPLLPAGPDETRFSHKHFRPRWTAEQGSLPTLEPLPSAEPAGGREAGFSTRDGS